MHNSRISVADAPLPIESAAIETPRGKDVGLLSLADLFIALVRDRKILFGFIAVGILLGCAAMPSRGPYAATTTILPPQSSVTSSLLGQFGSVASIGGGSSGAAALGMSRVSGELYVALLQSESVEDAVIRRFSLKAEYNQTSPMNARNILRSCLEVDATGRDGMIHVTLRDKDAKRSAELANGYVDEFKKFLERLAIGEASQRRTFFESQLAQEQVKLAQAEDALRKTEQTSGGIAVDAQTRSLIESAATLRGQIAAKEVELQSIRTYAGPENVNLLRTQQELAELRAQLTRVSGPAGSDDSLLISRKDVPESQIENLRAMRDLRYHESMTQLLSNQYQSARLDEASEGSPVQVVDPALVPELRSGLGKRQKLLYGFSGGLLAGVVFLLCREGIRALRREEAVEDRIRVLKATLRRA